MKSKNLENLLPEQGHDSVHRPIHISQVISFDNPSLALPQTPYALLIAAGKGDVHAVRQLIARGAPLEEKDSYGTTPLEVAILNGHLDVVKVLLDNGANVHAVCYRAQTKNQINPIENNKPLDLALENKRWEIAQEIILRHPNLVRSPEAGKLLPLEVASEALLKHIQSGDNSARTLAEINQLINFIGHLSQNLGPQAVLAKTVNNAKIELPISLILKSYANLCTQASVKKSLLSQADSIDTFSPLATVYLKTHPNAIAEISNLFKFSAHSAPQAPLKAEMPVALAALTEKILKPSSAAQTPQTRSETLEILDSIEKMVKQGQKYNIDAFQTPVAYKLKILASLTEDPILKSKMLKIANDINAYDPSEAIYCHAKDFMNTFPTGKDYSLQLGKDKRIFFKSDGYFGLFSTPLIKKSLDAFVLSLQAQALTPEKALKIKVFKSLAETFELATHLTANQKDPATAQYALEQYNLGKTILLPSGWDVPIKHFVDIMISKPEGFVGMSNSGWRFQENPAGTIMHKLSDPDRIDAAFFHEVLTNSKQKHLELELPHRYGFPHLKSDIVLPSDEQQYNNCPIESHRAGIEGLAFLELRKAGVPLNQAEKMADDFFHEFDNFHKSFELQEYLSNPLALPADALADVFVSLNQKGIAPNNFLKNYPSKVLTPEEHLMSVKLLDKLNTQEYLPGFQGWLKTKPEAHKLFQNYGVNTAEILKMPLQAEPGSAEEDSSESSINSLIKFFGRALGFSQAAAQASEHEQDAIAPHNPLLEHPTPTLSMGE